MNEKIKNNNDFIKQLLWVLIFLGLWYILKVCFVDKFITVRLAVFLVCILWIVAALLYNFIEHNESKLWFTKFFYKNYNIDWVALNKEYHEWLKNKVHWEHTISRFLRAMHPRDFENFVKLIYENLWYKIIYQSRRKSFWWHLKPIKDWWIDLIWVKNNEKTYIQIKNNINKIVAVWTVREINGIKDFDRWTIITTSVFSLDSKKTAWEKSIELIDYSWLEELLKSFSIDKKRILYSFLENTNIGKNAKYAINNKICKLCWAPLKRRKKWWFYGCQNYPDCKYTEQLKS